MKDHLFARLLRASGRLLLFTGAIISFGLVLINIYLYFRQLFNPTEAKQTIITITGADKVATAAAEMTPTRVVAIIACFVVVILLFVLIAKIYNNHIRRIIERTAHLFHAKIFTVEIVSTLIVWTIATLFFLITVPDISVATVFALIINELLFVIAWGAYGQPDYKK